MNSWWPCRRRNIPAPDRQSRWRWSPMRSSIAPRARQEGSAPAPPAFPVPRLRARFRPAAATYASAPLHRSAGPSFAERLLRQWPHRRAADFAGIATKQLLTAQLDPRIHHTFHPVWAGLRMSKDMLRAAACRNSPAYLLIRSRRLFLQPRHRPNLARREALEYGIVGINEGIISTEIASFGGMKESGIGPIWRLTGAQNTASRNSSKSNTSAWAASTDKASYETGRPGSRTNRHDQRSG